MAKMKQMCVLLFFDEEGEEDVDVGTAYAEYIKTGVQVSRDKIDFDKFNSVAMRIVVTAIGNEAGAGKGIEIYDVTNTTQLCEVTWDGSAQQIALSGSWVAQNSMIGDVTICARLKGSSATEDITIWKIELQIMYV